MLKICQLCTVWQLFANGLALTPARYPNVEATWTESWWNISTGWAWQGMFLEVRKAYMQGMEIAWIGAGTTCGHHVDAGTKIPGPAEAGHQSLAATGKSFNGCNLMLNNEHWFSRRYKVSSTCFMHVARCILYVVCCMLHAAYLSLCLSVRSRTIQPAQARSITPSWPATPSVISMPTTRIPTNTSSTVAWLPSTHQANGSVAACCMLGVAVFPLYLVVDYTCPFFLSFLSKVQK